MADTVVLFDPTAPAGSKFKSTAVRAEIGEAAEINLGPGSVTETMLADGGVTEDKIDDQAVTTPKLANGSVTAPKIAAEAVTESKIMPGAVTPAVVAAGIAIARDTSGNPIALKLVTISATAYAALPTKDSSTLYFVTP